jgi:hypothetical protein
MPRVEDEEHMPLASQARYPVDAKCAPLAISRVYG